VQSPALCLVHSSRARADSSGHESETCSGWAEPSTTHECCGRGKDHRCRGIFGPPGVALLTMLAAGDGEQDGWFFELLSSVSVLFFGVSSVVALSVTY